MSRMIVLELQKKEQSNFSGHNFLIISFRFQILTIERYQGDPVSIAYQENSFYFMIAISSSYSNWLNKVIRCIFNIWRINLKSHSLFSLPFMVQRPTSMRYHFGHWIIYNTSRVFNAYEDMHMSCQLE